MTYGIGRGPVRLAATPALRVIGDYQPYWRGDVFDEYIGTNWRRTSAGDPRVEQAVPPPASPAEFSSISPGRSAGLVRHRVIAETDLPLIFYAPGEVRAITLDTPVVTTAMRRLTLDGYGSARVPGGVLAKGTEYEVSSIPFEPGASADRYGGDDARYLKLPFESGRVADLAKKLVGTETDPRRRLTILADYLQKNCYYSLDAPAIPRGEDAVDYFVFTQKIGYCDLFASSLAIMGRAVGIPTRFVTGYAFPDSPPGEAADSETRLLKESDAHAWVEAYLPSMGWVTVDPTPTEGRTREGADWFRYQWLRLRMLWRTDPYGATALTFLGLIVVALVVLVLTGRIVIRSRLRVTEGDPQATVIAAYVRLCRLLRQYGHRRAEAQTPLEYLTALEDGRPRSGDEADGDRRRETSLGPEVLAPARALTLTFLDARYGFEPVSEEMAQSARRSFEAARDALRGNGKAKVPVAP